MEVLVSDVAVIVYECITLLFLIYNTFRLRKRNKSTAELVVLQMNRIREENLDASLRNVLYTKQLNKSSNINNPYDITYYQEENNVYDDARDRISIQVEEKGILSTKKYVVHVFDYIYIGSSDDNTIVLNDMTVGRHQIQLMKVERGLYIKNVGAKGGVTIVRGKRSQSIDEETVLLKSKDVIMVGNTSLKITII